MTKRENSDTQTITFDDVVFHWRWDVDYKAFEVTVDDVPGSYWILGRECPGEEKLQLVWHLRDIQIGKTSRGDGCWDHPFYQYAWLVSATEILGDRLVRAGASAQAGWNRWCGFEGASDEKTPLPVWAQSEENNK